MLVHRKKRVLQDYKGISVCLDDLPRPLCFPALFGRTAPVHVEIGSGKGTFLLHQARHNPESDFLGVEWANAYYRSAVDRFGRWGLSNVRMVRTEASVWVRNWLPDASVDGFHIYFPDPWPKKKHRKRRFFQGANLVELERILKPAGGIQFVTDSEDYFQQALRELEKECRQLKPTAFVPAAAAGQGEWVGTNYERKYRRENRPLYKLAFSKIECTKMCSGNV
ncbi:MAG: tRNA (guanosine(46)-N7)-methyltransferase TrmB [Sedimentisphaerales bacterium]|nr:tRNA (guanosine(46)-N7)-methyltransferase TrmB [Sedimentisphaerales bacterium]